MQLKFYCIVILQQIKFEAEPKCRPGKNEFSSSQLIFMFY